MATETVDGWNHYNVYCQTRKEADDTLARMLQERPGRDWELKVLPMEQAMKSGFAYTVTFSRKY